MNKKYIKRSLTDRVLDLAINRHKMLFISGPRQCGKTTFVKDLLLNKNNYFNWDTGFKKEWIKSPESFAEKILAQDKKPRIVLDEFHKNAKWKNQLKGFYDQYGDKIEIIVTGSSNLNTFRKGSDSLLGRFLHFHLHPFSLGEILNKRILTFQEFQENLLLNSYNSSKTEKDITEALFTFGGFPEPFLAQRKDLLNIWQKSRTELLVRQDIKDMSQFLNTNQVEILAALLPDRVGSVLSIQSLKEDLDVAHTTVTRWMNALMQVYYHFEVKPFSKKIPRSLKKDGKIYLYDWSMVENEGNRFENMVASHLLKLANYYTDTGQADMKLFYLRNKEKQEVDFVLTNKLKPICTFEVKLSDFAFDKTILKFNKYTQCPHIQIVKTPNIDRLYKEEKSRIISFDKFFSQLP